MIDFVLQMVASNFVVASLVVVAAMLVSRRTAWTHATYALWLLVLIVVLTPPILNFEIQLPGFHENKIADGNAEWLNEYTMNTGLLESAISAEEELAVAPARWAWMPLLKKLFVGCWLLGTLALWIVSCYRVRKFQNLINDSKVDSPGPQVKAMEGLARYFDTSSVCMSTVDANLSPLVWWLGGPVQVIMPVSIDGSVSFEQQRLILAHELAHVERRDYMVRWVEWLACTLFWWNPLVWIASRYLREAEEACCDELVIQRLNPDVKTYANSILDTVESLAQPAIRPPAMASQINSGGLLERRLKMILSKKQSRSRRWEVAFALVAYLLLPLGIMTAQEQKPTEETELHSLEHDHDHSHDHSHDHDHEHDHEHDHDGEHTYEHSHGHLGMEGNDKEVRRIPMWIFQEERAEIKKALEAGTLSEKEAEEALYKAMLAYEKALLSGVHQKQKEVASAVRAGMLSKSEAHKKLIQQQVDLLRETVQLKIDESVARGKLSDKEAEEKLAYALKVLESRQKEETYKMKLQSLVENGKLAREDAEAKIEAFMKERRERELENAIEIEMKRTLELREANKLTEAEALYRMALIKEKAAEVEKHRAAESKMESARRKIVQLVEDGKMTKEEAEKKLLDLQQSVLGVKVDNDVDTDVFWNRLKLAVEEGKITKEEARQKLRAMEEKLKHFEK